MENYWWIGISKYKKFLSMEEGNLKETCKIVKTC